MKKTTNIAAPIDSVASGDLTFSDRNSRSLSGGDGSADASAFYATDLRCENLEDPLGIYTSQPRLSWRMVSDAQGAAQSAYRILCATDPAILCPGKADLWDTGKVPADTSRLIPYGGKEIQRGIPSYWTVRIWNERGVASAWSEQAVWTYAGMASSRDWQARWITNNTSSPWLRRTFDLESVPSRAYIYCNVVGYFKLFINGKRVGADEFAPHVSQFNKRTFCITYDVTEYLEEGQNSVGFWLGRGWSGKTEIIGWDGLPGPSVRAQLEVADHRGQKTTVITDEKWRAKLSSVTYRGGWKWNHFGGEVHDARQDQPEWANPDFDDATWPQAQLAEVEETPVSAEMLQRSHGIETITPAKVKKLVPAPEGEVSFREHDEKSASAVTETMEEGTNWLVDMGQAMTGTFEITFPEAERGRRILLEFGDAYTPTGEGRMSKLNSFNQISEYICRGSGTETFRNQFNYASFRYVLITNAPAGEITAETIKGHFITTSLPKAGSFSCSDETLNKIHNMMARTLRCLMLGGYQVDCHSRERQGYGGDGHASLDTTLSLFRSDAFYRKWTRDWVDSQRPDGGLTYTAPATHHGGGPFWCGFLVAATLKHYRHYGDIAVVQDNYAAIKKWLTLAQSKTVNGLQQQFTADWEGGWYLGDWASPSGIDDERNAPVFINAYMSYALRQAVELAESLGKTDDAESFRGWAANRNAATHDQFYDPDGNKYGSGDQATYVLPLSAGVVPDALLDEVFTKFEKTLLEKDEGHLSTGLAGTYMMIQYLQSIGRDDLIYRFASKTTYPSWGHMIENGATATWEHWNGEASRIHNCYNSIGSWFIQGLAGIRPDPEKPGFKNAIIRPAFINELSYVNGSHDSVYGTIKSSWERTGDTIQMSVKIPANTTATVYVPSREDEDVRVNGVQVADTDHVTFLRTDNNETVIEIGAGRYEFTVKPQ